MEGANRGFLLLSELVPAVLVVFAILPKIPGRGCRRLPAPSLAGEGRLLSSTGPRDYPVKKGDSKVKPQCCCQWRMTGGGDAVKEWVS